MKVNKTFINTVNFLGFSWIKIKNYLALVLNILFYKAKELIDMQNSIYVNFIIIMFHKYLKIRLRIILQI